MLLVLMKFVGGVTKLFGGKCSTSVIKMSV